MKRTIAIILAVMMCAALLAGCGSGNGGSKEVKGETYDAGEMNALVPTGWKAFPVEDVFADEAGKTVPDKLNICKGGKENLDLLDHPYVGIAYFGPDTELMKLSTDYYNNVVELEPLKIGDATWNGFSADNDGTKFTVVWTGEPDGDQFQATIWTDTENGTISVNDADVQAILASVKASAKG